MSQIPIKTNLRCQTVTMTRTAAGTFESTRLYLFYTFKKRRMGVVRAKDRGDAKAKVLDLYPDAEFYR